MQFKQNSILNNKNFITKKEVLTLKKIIILSLIMLLNFTLVGCSNNNSKTSNSNSNKGNTMTCKWSRELNSEKNKDLSIEFIFNFNENDELVSVNENQAFYSSFDNIVAAPPSNTTAVKEKIEEIKYVKVDINVNKSSKDMFFNYIIDINAIKNDLYDEIITTDTYEREQYKYPYYIFTLSPEFLRAYIHYSKETLKVKLITDFNFNCR